MSNKTTSKNQVSSTLLLVGTLVILCSSCQSRRSSEIPDIRVDPATPVNLVDTIQLKRTNFRRELVSNGKLRALKKSDLRFKVSGQLEKINVKNGVVISEGLTLATLVQADARQKVAQAEIALKRSKLNLKDILLGLSGGQDSVSQESIKYEAASLSSGYAEAILSYQTSIHDLESTILKAPFKGKVANLSVKAHEYVDPGNVFCTLIDDSSFDIEFYLLESEISLINLHDELRIVPFAQNSEYLGYVSEINPIVNDRGMVLVKGTLKNQGSLWEGMNVRVVIGRNIPEQLVVPKSAVVMRQGQEVLFTYENGKAFWTYITIVAENSTSYSIKPKEEKRASIEAGTFVITTGNLNLAHESQVTIRE